jgi:hypothetical protein
MMRLNPPECLPGGTVPRRVSGYPQLGIARGERH